MRRPDWWKYETTSERVYVDFSEHPETTLPLIPNHPGTAESYDLEPQRVVPLYMDFEVGSLFFYDREAKDLGAS